MTITPWGRDLLLRGSGLCFHEQGLLHWLGLCLLPDCSIDLFGCKLLLVVGLGGRRHRGLRREFGLLGEGVSVEVASLLGVLEPGDGGLLHALLRPCLDLALEEGGLDEVDLHALDHDAPLLLGQGLQDHPGLLADEGVAVGGVEGLHVHLDHQLALALGHDGHLLEAASLVHEGHPRQRHHHVDVHHLLLEGLLLDLRVLEQLREAVEAEGGLLSQELLEKLAH
mmetsp:Transcript_210/g.373  ORF Transcript_210/g.373 Transcript_210/m.373 type:complete len:225 (-) Transcript_210:415-1089(-)